jgi:NADH-quinone oxidoreductase subunit L
MLPLVAAGLIACFFRRNGAVAAMISVGAALGIMICALSFLWNWDGAVVKYSWEWFTLGEFTMNMGYFIDDKAAIMLLVVSVVAFLIHVFSAGYMAEDSGKGRYFAGLSIFMFSMMGIVLADNLLMMFVFWELVGFSSYGLIAHYKDTDEAAQASKKAFIVNRVGDFGFIIGIIMCYWQFGTVEFAAMGDVGGSLSTVMGLLLICGFLGKSAQFPLHVWLPDAMAGPTPVSALIHAATMVAAGIYLLVRIFAILTPEVLTTILWLGAVMTAFAGLCALGQRDIKKILAYSTLSQLGYMAVAVGLGYPGLALFHLGTHACFKALLFLGSGSVIHGTDHEQDIFNMGGLLKKMPITGVTFAIGLLALCGVTMTSGYFSKDAIIEASYFSGVSVFAVVMFSAFMTSLYMGRLFWIVFFGKGRTEHAREAHESPAIMTGPLMILAVLSLIAGFVKLWPAAWSTAFVGELDKIHGLVTEGGLSVMMLVLTTLAWILGLGLSYVMYGKQVEADPLSKKMPNAYKVLESKFWFDEVYGFYVKHVQQRVADVLSFFDLVFIGGFLVRGSAGLVGLAGLMTRALHVGSIHSYVLWFLLGAVIFVGYIVF